MSKPPVLDPVTGEVFDASPEEDDGLGAVEVAELRALVAAYRHHTKGLQTDVLRAQRDLLVKNRRIAQLEAELDEQRMEAPEAAEVKAIFHGWVKATGRNTKRTKLGVARQKAVLARLREGHDAERVYRAVTIGVQAATVSDQAAERVALLAALRTATDLLSDSNAAAVRDVYRERVGQVTRYDDLELLCRNEVQVERFAELADRIDPPKPGAAPGIQTELAV